MIDRNRVDCEAICGLLADSAKLNCEVLECVMCEPFSFISLGCIICPDVVRLLFPSLL